MNSNYILKDIDKKYKKFVIYEKVNKLVEKGHNISDSCKILGISRDRYNYIKRCVKTNNIYKNSVENKEKSRKTYFDIDNDLKYINKMFEKHIKNI